MYGPSPLLARLSVPATRWQLPADGVVSLLGRAAAEKRAQQGRPRSPPGRRSYIWHSRTQVQNTAVLSKLLSG